MTDDVWYRYEDVQYAGPVNEDGDSTGYPGPLRVELRKYPVRRHTPKGVWLSGAGSRYSTRMDRFVLKDANRRFACPTLEEAKASFIARKKRQIRIYEARLGQAQTALEHIITGKAGGTLYGY